MDGLPHRRNHGGRKSTKIAPTTNSVVWHRSAGGANSSTTLGKGAPFAPHKVRKHVREMFSDVLRFAFKGTQAEQMAFVFFSAGLQGVQLSTRSGRDAKWVVTPRDKSIMRNAVGLRCTNRRQRFICKDRYVSNYLILEYSTFLDNSAETE